MKRLSLLFVRLVAVLMGMMGPFCYGQPQAEKKVAIYVARGNGDQKMASYAKFFASELQLAVSRSAKYNAVERTGKFLELLSREQSYQRTGQVDENKIAELGKQEGVNFVLSVDMTDFGNNSIYVVWKLIDVETAVVQDGDSEIKEIVNMVADLKSFSEALTKRITGGASTSGSSRYGSSSQTNYGTESGTNYTETVFGINMKMVYVEGGSFIMGCTGEQGSDCENDEKNTRRVNLTGYYIGMTEVTQGQWQRVMGTSVEQQRNKANPNWPLRGTGADFPMYYVSWEEAMAFCEELSRQTGKRYTLPTEAQWEYAARGGNKNDGTKYSGSYSIDAVAWYSGNSDNGTHMVGSRRPNGLGLYDMSGNVYEWCKDWYADSYIGYQTDNPTGPSGGSDRVRRGGSWSSDARVCRVSYRNYYSPGYRDRNLGFRVVCVPF